MPLLLCQLSCCASIFIVVPVLSELSLQQPKLAVSFAIFDIFTFGSSRKRGSWRKRGWHCAIVHLGSNVVYIIVAQTLSTNVYSTLYIEVQPSCTSRFNRAQFLQALLLGPVNQLALSSSSSMSSCARAAALKHKTEHCRISQVDNP